MRLVLLALLVLTAQLQLVCASSNAIARSRFALLETSNATVTTFPLSSGPLPVPSNNVRLTLIYDTQTNLTYDPLLNATQFHNTLQLDLQSVLQTDDTHVQLLDSVGQSGSIVYLYANLQSVTLYNQLLDAYTANATVTDGRPAWQTTVLLNECTSMLRVCSVDASSGTVDVATNCPVIMPVTDSDWRFAACTAAALPLLIFTIFGYFSFWQSRPLVTAEEYALLYPHKQKQAKLTQVVPVEVYSKAEEQAFQQQSEMMVKRAARLSAMNTTPNVALFDAQSPAQSTEGQLPQQSSLQRADSHSTDDAPAHSGTDTPLIKSSAPPTRAGRGTMTPGGSVLAPTLAPRTAHTPVTASNLPSFAPPLLPGRDSQVAKAMANYRRESAVVEASGPAHARLTAHRSVAPSLNPLDLMFHTQGIKRTSLSYSHK